jgi:FimV-like protein
LLIKKALKLNSSSPEAKLGLVKAYIQLNKYMKARELIEDVLESGNDTPFVWEALGTLELQEVGFKRWRKLRIKGNENECIKAYSRALSLDPKNVHIILSRAVAYKQFNKPEEALADAAKLEKLDVSIFKNFG